MAKKVGCDSSMKYEIKELKEDLRYYAHAGKWRAAIDTAKRLDGLLPICKK